MTDGKAVMVHTPVPALNEPPGLADDVMVHAPTTLDVSVNVPVVLLYAFGVITMGVMAALPPCTIVCAAVMLVAVGLVALVIVLVAVAVDKPSVTVVVMVNVCS